MLEVPPSMSLNFDLCSACDAGPIKSPLTIWVVLTSYCLRDTELSVLLYLPAPFHTSINVLIIYFCVIPVFSVIALFNEDMLMGKTQSGCQVPKSVHHSHQLWGPISYLSYNLSPQVLQDRPQFSLDFRTKTANGLLFYISSIEGKSYLALYLLNGRIRLALGRKQIFIREKCNNGRWHTAMFSWEESKFRLVMDGLHVKEGQLTSEEGLSLNLQPPVYLGMVPASVHTKHEWKSLPRESVIGCIRNFNLNGRPMGSPSVNHAAPPCFNGSSESGVYFSGHGGFVVLEDSFVVGFNFELVFEVRPRNLTGVLFHIESPHGHHLSLFMKKGQVTVQVNNGAGQFGVSVMPQQSLCDGMFHRVAVIKRNNVVQLDVDTEGQYTVGPSSSIFTDTNDPLYVGGLPENSHHSSLPFTTSLVGCIQNVRINLERVSFDKVTQVSGPVNLRECPAG